MDIFWYLFAAFAAAAFAADVYDVTQTEKGLKAGIAVESFTWLVGTKPTAKALYLRDALLIAITLFFPVLFHFKGNAPLAYGALISPAVAAIKHVLGGRAWANLLAGGKLPTSETAWQKFWRG